MINTMPADSSAPIRAVWQGTINAASKLVVAIDSAGAFTATVNGGSATFTSEDGATVEGEIMSAFVTVLSGQGAVVARYRANAAWDPDASVAGALLVPPANYRTSSYRGQGIRKTAFVVAGYATQATGAARNDVDVEVILELRGLGK